MHMNGVVFLMNAKFTTSTPLKTGHMLNIQTQPLTRDTVSCNIVLHFICIFERRIYIYSSSTHEDECCALKVIYMENIWEETLRTVFGITWRVEKLHRLLKPDQRKENTKRLTVGWKCNSKFHVEDRSSDAESLLPTL